MVILGDLNRMSSKEFIVPTYFHDSRTDMQTNCLSKSQSWISVKLELIELWIVSNHIFDLAGKNICMLYIPISRCNRSSEALESCVLIPLMYPIVQIPMIIGRVGWIYNTLSLSRISRGELSHDRLVLLMRPRSRR